MRTVLSFSARILQLRQKNRRKQSDKKDNTLTVHHTGTVKMAPWEDFDTIFYFNKNFAYDDKIIDQILSNRRALENQLFADRLFGLLGVQAGRHFSHVHKYEIEA